MPDDLNRRAFLAGGAAVAAGAFTWVAAAAPGKPKKPHPHKTPTPSPATTTLEPSPVPTVTRTRTLTAPSEIVNLPAQPYTIAYGSTMTNVSSYATPGGLVIAGRENYNNATMQSVSAGGGTVLIYIDPMITNPFGLYADLLYNSSIYGGAVPDWPGLPQANAFGFLADFRVGGTLQSKWEPVLQQMVADNPHMGGFFVDDVGSRSWFPLLNWSSDFTATERQEYRDGAIALCQTLRDVCNEHGLMFIVNGTWSAGTLDVSGGGYPTMGTHGLSLAEGGFVELHTLDAFWEAYAGGQWADDSPLAQGEQFMVSVNATTGERDDYINSGLYSYCATQSDYDTPVAPWGSFHATGLPSQVT